MNYSFFNSIRSKSCVPVTVEELVSKLKTPFIKNTCENILKLLEEGKEEDASRLKTSLPVIVLGQLYENGQTRTKGGGKPTGLLMIDYDDCKTIEEAKQLMAHIKEKWLSDIMLRDIIVAAHFSPRMHGVHIWYRWIDGCHSYEECNERIAQMLERPDYDESCKDNSRCSFLVPIDYFQICNWDAMANNDDFAKLQAEQENPDAPTIKKEKKNDAEETPSNAEVVVDKSAYPMDYDGIPYADIVQQLTLKCAPKKHIDHKGNVMHGARNNTWFKLCCLLRYICDDDPDWLCAIAPEWAWEHETGKPGRVREVAVNACKRGHSFSTPKTLQAVLDSFSEDSNAEQVREARKKNEEEQQKYLVEQMEGIEESVKKFLMFPKKLPPIFQEFCDGVKPEWKVAVVLTLLPTLGTLMSKLRAPYLDKRLHSPSFQTVIEAKMASGKQNFADIADFVLAPVTALDLEGNIQLNIYNQESVKANGAKTLATPPDVCVRKMIGKFTEAGLNGTLDTSKGLHIWSGVSEIDEVADVWKQLSYILRLAYDNAPYGRTLQSQKQFRGERKLFLNTFLCGTPHAINRVYNDPEDGLVSRTIFFKLIVETPGIPLNKVSDRAKQQMAKLLQKIHDKYTISPEGEVALETEINLDYVNKHLQKWLERKNLEAVEYGSEAIERFRRRDACNGFRAAMVAHCLYINKNKNGKLSEADKNIVKDFAEWVAEYSLMMHDYKFGKKLNEILAEDEMNETTSKIPILNMLPDTFTLAEAYRTFKNRSQGSVRGTLTKLVQKGLLVSEERGMYSKK